jgi:O-antigen/teichoic acid export membrane protein
MTDPERHSVVRDAREAIVSRRDIVESAGVFFLYSGLSLLFLFLFNLLMARYLGAQQYSVLGTFMSVLMTAILVSGTIYLVITRFIAYHHTRAQYEEINYLVTTSLKYFFAAGFLVFLIFLIFSDHIAAFFNLDDIRPVVALGFAVWLQLLVPVYEAAFKGLDDMHAMGRMRVIENAARWIIGLLFAYVALGLTSMILALGLGTFVALALAYNNIRALQSRQTVRPNMSEIWAYARPAILMSAAIALLLNLDIILVKHWFPPDEAGVYAIASFLAKIPFVISWMIGTVLFPRVTKAHVDGLHTTHMLRSSLKWLIGSVLVSTLFVGLFADKILESVFGGEYSFGLYIIVYAFSMGLLSIVNILTIYQLGLKRFTLAKIIPWFVLLEIILLWQFHAIIFHVVVSTILVTSSLVAVTIYVLRDELQLERIFNE